MPTGTDRKRQRYRLAIPPVSNRDIGRYQKGQILTQALHDAAEYAIAREAVVFRSASPSEYRLSQAADYACAVELTALKYREHEETPTDRRFFGAWSSFKRNVLKTVRRKAM